MTTAEWIKLLEAVVLALPKCCECNATATHVSSGSDCAKNVRFTCRYCCDETDPVFGSRLPYAEAFWALMAHDLKAP
jgi:transposase-like protein